MLKRPHFALNPSRTLVARGAGYLQIELWWVDRDDDQPICELPVHGAGVGGVHFCQDDILWVLSTDGWLTSWNVKALIAWSEQNTAAEPDPVPQEAPEDSEHDEQVDDDEPAPELEPEPEVPDHTSGPAFPEPNWRVRLDADVTIAVGCEQLLAVGDRRGQVWLIEGHGGRAHVRLGTEQHDDAVVALAFSRNGLSLASSGRDRVIRTWRSADSEGLSETSLVGESTVLEFFSVAYESPRAVVSEPADDSPEPESVDESAAEADEEAEPQVEQPEASEEGRPRPAPLRIERRLTGLEGWQVAVAYSPDGSRLATGGVDQGLYLFDLTADEDQPSAIQFAHSGWIADLDWSRDGTVVATGSWDNTIGLFDGTSLEPLVCFELHRDYVCDVEFAGNLLCAASHDREISIWDWRGRRLDKVLTGHADWIEAISVLDTKRLLSVSSDRTVRVYDLDSGECSHVLGASDALESFEIGSAVDMSDYVDLSELASYRREDPGAGPRYRDYRASGFRSTTEKTALGLLEGAIEAAPAAQALAPSHEDRSDPAQALDDVPLAPTVEPDLNVPKPDAVQPDLESEPQVKPEPAPEPDPDPEPVSEADPEPDPDPDVEPAAEPEADAEAESAPAPAPDPEQEVAPEPEPEVAEPQPEPAEVPQPKVAPEPEREEVAEIAPKPELRSEHHKKELERVWRREPSIGTTTIRRIPPQTEGEEPLEASITGANEFTSFDSSEADDLPLTMGLGDEPSERFETSELKAVKHEEIADPPSIEMGGLSMGGEMSEASVDEEWEELEQTVDASVFRTHGWANPIVDKEDHLPSQTGEWDVSLADSLSDTDAPPAEYDSVASEVEIPSEFVADPDEVTAELPAEQVAELRARSDAVSQTGSHEIWERLPSRETPRSEILSKRARPGATKFALSHTIRTPHKFVYGVSISPDGRLIATCGGDNSMCVWRRSGELLYRVRVGLDGLNAISFSFDGRAIVAGGDEMVVHIWLLPSSDDPTVPIEHAELRGHTGWISDVSFAADGSFVLTGSYDGTARVWKLSTGQCVRILSGHESAVSGVAIGTTRALTAGHDGSVCVWNQHWQQVDLLPGHDTLLGISTDGQVAAYCAADGEVFVLRDGRPSSLMQHRGQARAALVRGEGMIMTVGEDGAMRVYQRDASGPAQSLSMPTPLWCVDACGDVAAAGGDDGAVYVFQETT